MKKYSDIINKISGAERILLTSHVDPEKDTVAAGVALFLTLDKYNKIQSDLNENYMDKTFRFILDGNIHNDLKFIDGTEMIENIKNVEIKYPFDLVICLGSDRREKMGSTEKFIGEDSFIINIDHHADNTQYGDINCVEDVSSTSEIIYNLIRETEIEIDTSMKDCMGDKTDDFVYSSVSLEK